MRRVISIGHEVRLIHGGSGMDSWIQPFCTCGWCGRIHFSSEDLQYTNAREAVDDHAKNVFKKIINEVENGKEN